MSKDNNQEYEIISKGNNVMLRTRVETDREIYRNRWIKQGEWLEFDAPWETRETVEKSDQKPKEKRKKFKEDEGVKKLAIISTLDQIPLGWVNRYGDQNNPYVWFVGIDICEDKYLNKGYGTEVLKLWVDYLFSNSEIHKLCLDTWSFNPRMMRVAEKIGFQYEGCQREMRFWENKWRGMMHYGMLREEWERSR